LIFKILQLEMLDVFHGLHLPKHHAGFYRATPWYFASKCSDKQVGRGPKDLRSVNEKQQKHSIT